MTGKKLTPKQEKFCKKYIETGNASEAYRHAYKAEKTKASVIHVKASEVLSNGNVTVRVKELQEMELLKHLDTVESIAKELNEARDMAIANNAPAVMVTASMSKAKLRGLLVDKVEVADVTDHADLLDKRISKVEQLRNRPH
jgi:phage terminase small subunit